MVKNKTSQNMTIYYMYVILSTVLIPLFIENKYFNITKAKADIFFVGSLGILLSLIVCFLSKKRRIKSTNQKHLLFPFLFPLCALLSSIFSNSFTRSFWGADGWRIGLYTISALSVLFFYLSIHPVDSIYMLKVISVVNIFIFGLVITDSMRIDIFGLHEMMLPNQYYDYVSTIGNVNQMSGYLCLTVIYLFAIVLTDKKSKWRTLSAFTLILGFFCVILCKSDSFYLGAGFCAFFMIDFVFKEKLMVQKTITLGMAFCLVSLFIRFCGLFGEKLNVIDGISRILLNPMLSGSTLIILLVILLLIRYIDVSDRILKIIRNILFISLITFVIYMTITNIKAVSADYYHWGSGRGAIWFESYRLYCEEYSIFQKLFGVGPDMLGQWYANLSIGFGQRVLVSHSEPIQVLMSMGAIGFVIYSTMTVLTVKKIIENKDDKDTMKDCLPVVAYYGQSLVNSANTTSLALLVLFLVHIHRNYSKGK